VDSRKRKHFNTNLPTVQPFFSLHSPDIREPSRREPSRKPTRCTKEGIKGTLRVNSEKSFEPPASECTALCQQIFLELAAVRMAVLFLGQSELHRALLSCRSALELDGFLFYLFHAVCKPLKGTPSRLQ